MKRRSKALRIKSILCALVLLCISTASFVGCSNGKVEQSSAVSSVSSVSETVSSDESKADTAAVSEAKENTVSDNSSAVSSVSETASSEESKADTVEPSKAKESSVSDNSSADTSSKAESKSEQSSEISETSTETKNPERQFTPPEKYTIDNIRSYVVGVDEDIELADGTKRPLINFDNAATTPALVPVQNEVNKELEMYGSIGRGYSQKSNHSTDVYNEVRKKVINFVGADDGGNDIYTSTYTAFFVNNTTDGLNKLASALVESEDDIVLATRIEHHANDLSWRERCHVIYAEVDEKGRVIYDDIERLLRENKGKVKYVTVTAASNVTGYVTDVHRVAKMAHKYGAKIIVYGAQIVTPEENIDFFVFSAHKMYSPYGGGAVVGLREVLDKHQPEFYGGGTVNLVQDDKQSYKRAPEVYEAGSPNYPGVVGLGKAIDVLQEIGFDNIEAHEKALNRKLIDGLKKLDNIVIYGDTENIDDRVGVVSFNFNNINSLILATYISDNGGVATRRGAFCAHPYVWRLMKLTESEIASFEGCTDIKTAGMIRISLGIYNTEEEVQKFLDMMPYLMEKSTVENFFVEKRSVDKEIAKSMAEDFEQVEAYLRY